MAGRTTTICGFQTDFRTLFLAGRTAIICEFQTNFRLCLWREKQRLFVDSKPISAHCLCPEEQLFANSKPISAICSWREEQRIFVASKPFSPSVYGGKNYDYLWIPNQFPHTVFYGNNTIFRTQYMREVNFLQTEISGKYTDFLWIPNKFPHTVYGRKNNDYLRIPNFPHTVYGGKNNNYLWIPNHFPIVFMAGRTTIICGFQTNFRTKIWQEEQQLSVNSKPISAHCLWREEQRLFVGLFVDSKPNSAHCLWREEQ